MFQDFNLVQHMSALEDVSLAADIIGSSWREGRRKAPRLLADLGLKDKSAALPARPLARV